MAVFLKKLIKSFGYAGHGIVDGSAGRNFRIHLLMTIGVIAAGAWLGMERWEWVAVLILIGAVLMAELFNTAIEATCDLLKQKLHLEYSETTVIRDVAAGAVLVMASVAAAVGLIIFLPKLF